jgi:hypothetical protein
MSSVFVNLAQRWSRLAIDLQAAKELLEKWGDKPTK